MPQLVGKTIGEIGFGLMGFTWRDPQPPQDQAFQAMRAALAAGANFWNGGEFYGPPNSNSLHLLNAYFKKYPEDADKVVLSIKGGIDLAAFKPDGSTKGVHRSMDDCLKTLGGVKKLDLFECARVDPNVRIEESMEALAEYVKAGKLGGISLSEPSASAIRRAAKVVKVEFVEVEFSLFETEILENGVAKACAELGIPIVAYSPLGRGFLTGAIKKPEDAPQLVKTYPRFTGENFWKNMDLVSEVEKVAESKGCPISQVAIAWVLQQSGKNGNPHFIPIPGATTEARVQENSKVVSLTDAELAQLDEALKKCTVAGTRYPEQGMHLNFGDGAP